MAPTWAVPGLFGLSLIQQVVLKPRPPDTLCALTGARLVKA